MSLNVILIEDDAVDELYPLSLTSNSWQLRTGRHTIIERWRAALSDASIAVHSHRTLHQKLYEHESPNPDMSQSAPLLIVLSTFLLSPESMKRLAHHASQISRAGVIVDGTSTVGAILPMTPIHVDDIISLIDTTPSDDVDLVSVEGKLVRRSWDVLDAVSDGVAWDASLAPCRIAPSAKIDPTAVIDESLGPVLIDEDAVIGALSVLQGPISIGAHAVVKPLAHITHSVIGPHCKVGGEVSVSVLHGFSNKQHYGFLGHTVIGHWVNLGAGTTTSNLKNTYHDVRPRMPWGREDSGRLFLGSLIGDYTRTAIGTLLPTGGVYGVCTHIMAPGLSVSKQSSFVWSDGVVYDREKAFETCDAMMKRRGLELSELHRQVLDDVRGRDA
jgi:UDP-N-acetylglucosamine diphosphorylase/glucosamine-1-phosphate N-acetyltransferase